MLEHIVERGRLQTAIWRMRVACCIPKATNTHSEYVMLIAFFFSVQQRLCERVSLLQIHCLYCFDSHFDYRTVSTASLHCYSSLLSVRPMCPCMSIALRMREISYVSRYTDKVRGSISGGSRSFSSAERSHLLWTAPSFLVRGIRGSFPGVGRPGREADLSLPSSAKVKNEWSCTSPPTHTPT